MFEDDEEHSKVAAIFNTELSNVTEKSEREKALHDLVFNIKKNSCEAAASKPNQTMEDMMKDIENKRALEQLKKLSFKLDD